MAIRGGRLGKMQMLNFGCTPLFGNSATAHHVVLVGLALNEKSLLYEPVYDPILESI